MTVQYYFSLIVFALFIALVLGRAAILRRKGIRVIVFGETDKSDFLLVPCVLAVIYAVLTRDFGLPMWEPLIRPFWNTLILGWVGTIICVIAVAGFALTLASFGDSFRVGIDEKKADKLVTTGMFSFSRNPIYVCFNLFFFGMFLIHRNIIILAAIVWRYTGKYCGKRSSCNGSMVRNTMNTAKESGDIYDLTKHYPQFTASWILSCGA